MNDNELVVEREIFSFYGWKYLLSDYIYSEDILVRPFTLK